jgi:hypothetical protein
MMRPLTGNRDWRHEAAVYVGGPYDGLAVQSLAVRLEARKDGVRHHYTCVGNLAIYDGIVGHEPFEETP